MAAKEVLVICLSLSVASAASNEPKAEALTLVVTPDNIILPPKIIHKKDEPLSSLSTSNSIKQPPQAIAPTVPPIIQVRFN